MIVSAVIADSTQPAPLITGLMIIHNTIVIVERIMTAIHFAIFLMRLRLKMDALPRLTDMLLFVFIVRHFLMRLGDYRSFACSLNSPCG